MEILFFAPEVAPYSRSSEVADVCAALPKALRSVGHKVTVITPMWAGIDATARTLARRLSGVQVEVDGERMTCTLFDGRTTGGVELVFVAHPELFGNVAGPDGSAAGLRAAAAFAQAAAAVAGTRTPTPEAVHAHGYFAAAALPLCVQSVPAATRTLSLHDASEQGAGVKLPPALAELAGGATGNLLLLGVGAAQKVIARSTGEAAHLLQGALQGPLQGALQGPDAALRAALEGKLTGIANGVDAARWNPLTDTLLPARYDAATRTGKARCKDALQLELALPVRAEVPLIACGEGPSGALSEPTRAMLAKALPAVLRGDVQVVLLGVNALGESVVAELRARFGDRFACVAQGDERGQHRAIAAADLLLVPGRNTQTGDLHLVGQRYGAVPIGPSEAPIADGIVDCEASLVTGTGFLFEPGKADDLVATVQRAVAAFSEAEAFARLQHRVMRLDLSWERSARHYEHGYKSAAAPRA